MVWGQMSWLVAEGSQTGSRQAASVQAGRWSVPGGPLQVVLAGTWCCANRARTSLHALGGRGGRGCHQTHGGAWYRQEVRGDSVLRKGFSVDILAGVSKSEREVAQSWPTLCDPKDCSPPGSSIGGIFQARGTEWAAMSLPAWCCFESTGGRLGSLEPRRGNLVAIQFIEPRKK